MRSCPPPSRAGLGYEDLLHFAMLALGESNRSALQSHALTALLRACHLLVQGPIGGLFSASAAPAAPAATCVL